MLAASFWRASQPLFAHVEYAGPHPAARALAATFGDRDLVIVESRDASDVHVLALPLAYIYARNVLLLANRTPDPLQFKAFLDWARTRYASVFFIGGGGTELLSRDVAVQAVDTQVFQIPEWESPRNALPSGRTQQGVRLQRLPLRAPRAAGTAAPDAAPPTTTGPTLPATRATRDIAVADPRPRRQRRPERAALPCEGEARATASRSGGRATCPTSAWSACLQPHAPSRFVMDDGHRPPGVAPAVIVVSLNDMPRLAVVGRNFHTYTFAIPPAVAAEAAARTGRRGSSSRPTSGGHAT